MPLRRRVQQCELTDKYIETHARTIIFSFSRDLFTSFKSDHVTQTNSANKSIVTLSENKQNKTTIDVRSTRQRGNRVSDRSTERRCFQRVRVGVLHSCERFWFRSASVRACECERTCAADVDRVGAARFRRAESIVRRSRLLAEKL